MLDIRFNFSKIGEEEMKMIAGGRELQDKWSTAIRKFTENTDPDDPEYITLRDAFMQRFKEHGFVVDSIAKFNQESKELDEIIERLIKLQESNNRLQKNTMATLSLPMSTNEFVRRTSAGCLNISRLSSAIMTMTS